MVRSALIWLFYVYLLIPAFAASHIQVDIFLLPYFKPVTMPLSIAILLFATLGVVVTLILAMLDRTQLRAQNRKLHKEMDRLQAEMVELRQAVTLERDGE